MTEHEYRVESTREELRPLPWLGVRRDTVAMPDGDSVERFYVDHSGAVVVAAVDEQDRVALIHQYRHPAGTKLWELPAGLRDVAGEDPVETARRELAEEIDLVAQHWRFLSDVYPSPGYSNERVQVFVATGLSTVSQSQRFRRTHEEADLTVEWLPLSRVPEEILSGRIVNGVTIIALLTVLADRDRHH